MFNEIYLQFKFLPLPPLPPCSTAGSRDLTLRPLLSFHGSRNKENFQSRDKSTDPAKHYIYRERHCTAGAFQLHWKAAGFFV